MTPAPRDDRASSIEELAALTRAGDEEAFLLLVRRTQGRLVAFLRVLLGCAADAEEVAQETYLRAWRRRRRYATGRPYPPWLFTIARRLAIGRLRTRTARGATVGLEAAADAIGASSPVLALADGEARDGLWARARRLLGPAAAEALWLRYAEDLSAAEIGRVLGKREGAVRTLLQRARERLSQDLTVASDAPGRTRPLSRAVNE